MSENYRSLASAAAGEQLAIHKIVSRETAKFCDLVGLHEGDALVCRANTRSHLILRTHEGRVITLDQNWARYIQVVCR
jgi:hypothetical protein